MPPFTNRPIVRPKDDPNPVYSPIVPQPRREATADEYASNRRMLRAIQAGGNPQGILDLFQAALDSDYDEALPQALDFLETLEPVRPDLRNRLNQTILASAQSVDDTRTKPAVAPAQPLEQHADAVLDQKRALPGNRILLPIRPDFGGGGGTLNRGALKRSMLGRAEQKATQTPPLVPKIPSTTIPAQVPAIPDEQTKPVTPTARGRRAAEKIAGHHVVEIKDNTGVRYLVLVEKSKGMSETEWTEKVHKKAAEAFDYMLK